MKNWSICPKELVIYTQLYVRL